MTTWHQWIRDPIAATQLTCISARPPLNLFTLVSSSALAPGTSSDSPHQFSEHQHKYLFSYFSFLSVHRQGGRVLYRKITRKLSETSRKISRKFSSKKVCTASDAIRASTLKPISRSTAQQSNKIPKYSDDPDKTTLKPMLQRRRKITESRRPLVDRSDVKPNGDNQALITLDSCNSLKNNTGLTSRGPDSPDSETIIL